jgi:hypothetical protein
MQKITWKLIKEWKGLCLFPVALVFFLPCIAQDVKKDVAKINRTYENATYMSGDVAFKYYETYTSTQSTDETFGKFSKNGSNTYYKYESFELLVNKQLTLTVDHENEIMMLSNPQTITTQVSRPESINFDTLLKYCKSVNYKVEGTKVSYTLNFDFYTTNAIKVYFDRSTYLISKLIIYYNQAPVEGASDKPRIEISYSNLKKNKSAVAVNTIGSYVVQAKGKYVTTARYKGYKLINFLLTN